MIDLKSKSNTLIKTVLVEKSPFKVFLRIGSSDDNRVCFMVTQCVSWDSFILACVKSDIQYPDKYSPLNFFLIVEGEREGYVIPKMAYEKLTPKKQ